MLIVLNGLGVRLTHNPDRASVDVDRYACWHLGRGFSSQFFSHLQPFSEGP